MKWYYFYTKDYEFWHNHLSSNLTNDYEVNPILIDDLVINKTAIKHQLAGNTKKIELIVDCIQKNLGKKINPKAITDCT